MGFLIKKGLKQITKVFDNGQITDMASSSYLIALTSENINIVSIKLTANAAITGYTSFTITDSQSNLPVAHLNITSIADNYTFYFCIGYSALTNQCGYNFKNSGNGLNIIAETTPSTSATELTIEINYFD